MAIPGVSNASIAPVFQRDRAMDLDQENAKRLATSRFIDGLMRTGVSAARMGVSTANQGADRVARDRAGLREQEFTTKRDSARDASRTAAAALENEQSTAAAALAREQLLGDRESRSRDDFKAALLKATVETRQDGLAMGLTPQEIQANVESIKGDFASFYPEYAADIGVLPRGNPEDNPLAQGGGTDLGSLAPGLSGDAPPGAAAPAAVAPEGKWAEIMGHLKEDLPGIGSAAENLANAPGNAGMAAAAGFHQLRNEFPSALDGVPGQAAALMQQNMPNVARIPGALGGAGKAIAGVPGDALASLASGAGRNAQFLGDIPGAFGAVGSAIGRLPGQIARTFTGPPPPKSNEQRLAERQAFMRSQSAVGNAPRTGDSKELLRLLLDPRYQSTPARPPLGAELRAAVGR